MKSFARMDVDMSCPNCRELKDQCRKFLKLARRLVDQVVYCYDEEGDVRVPEDDFALFREQLGILEEKWQKTKSQQKV